MATLEELQSRLAIFHESLDELRGLIERLGAGVRPAGSQEADDLLDEEAVTDLAAEIADGLRDAHDEQELLQEDLADLGTTTVTATATASATVTTPTTPTPTTAPESTSHGRARLRAGFARIDQELQIQHAAFRKARLQARQSLEKTQRRERQAVLAAYVYEEEEEEEELDENNENNGNTGVRLPVRTPSTRNPPSATAAAAADVTAALRQTHARIAGEVARSDFAAQTLAESSRALTELGDRYGSGGSSEKGGGGDIASSLQSARHLVRGLVAAHKSDTWYLQTALYLLLATVGWLLFRRLLYGPLWLLVWWPVRTAWATVATAVGLGRAGAGLLTHDAAAANSIILDSSSSNSPLVHTETPILSGSTTVAAAATPTPSTSTSTSTAPETDSLVEQVGQIVDGHGSAEEQPKTQEEAPSNADSQDSQDSQNAQRNPMKRMWEEDVEAAKYEEQQKEQEKEHTRDEL